jgi:hypothetical protein
MKNLSPLTDKEVDTLTSFADGQQRIQRERRINLSELLNLALDVGVEQCPGCKWWAESGEMIPDGSEDTDGKCSNCRQAPT